MAIGQLNGVIENLRRKALRHDDDCATDGHLLDGFIRNGDEAAFEGLVQRHGAMVWGVCLRVLGNPHDAEDAFQAAFLVLVGKAGSVCPRDKVGSWLHGVAYRTALKARSLLARQRHHEKQVQDMPATAVQDAELWSDVRPVLDRELNRLADHYRLPVVLCDIEGKSQREAARQLGWPEGTLMTRLSRARQKLAKRLTQQGITVSAGALAMLLSQQAASAQVPAPLALATVHAAALIAAGQATTATVSAAVAALTEGVINAMFLTKMKSVLTIVLTIALIGAGGGWLTHRVLAGRLPAAEQKVLPGAVHQAEQRNADKVQPRPEFEPVMLLQRGEFARGRDGRQDVRGTVKAVDAKSITVATGGGRETAAVEKTYSLAKDVEVAVGGSAFRVGGFFKEAKLADLHAGTTVSLTLTADQKTVDSILAEEPAARGILKAVDAKKGILTISRQVGREAADEELTYTVAADADIALDDGRGQRFSLHEGKLEDLATGAMVTLRLSLDKKQVHSILAEGALVGGTIKSLDPTKRTMTLTVRPARGDEAAEERALPIAKEAVILLDNGKGRRLSVKQVKLADVPVGATAMVKLSADQGFVMLLKAEGPTLMGLLKAVDTDKHTITIAIPRGRNESDDKTLPLAKDARIALDGKAVALGALKANDDGPIVHLRLTLDQTTVQSVNAQQPGSR